MYFYERCISWLILKNIMMHNQQKLPPQYLNIIWRCYNTVKTVYIYYLTFGVFVNSQYNREWLFSVPIVLYNKNNFAIFCITCWYLMYPLHLSDICQFLKHQFCPLDICRKLVLYKNDAFSFYFEGKLMKI